MAYALSQLLKKSDSMARTLYKLDGYCKYGFYHDDLIGGYNTDVNPKVSEAYRRMAIDNPEAHDQRVYRSLRATQLKIQKKILPREQWTTYEDDITKGRYLQPYLQQIEKEEREKAEIAMMEAE